ncbi:MAG: zinc ribbon domain-containing protein [Deltaproteobacteria bacterium]|nr:zinc ribbon domain-containing protein [Deltaproteobacteria bacterium]
MPIYEYHCSDCGRVSEHLVLKRDQPVAPVCPRCGGRSLTRVMSRFRVAVSEETRMERLAELAERGGLDDRDPRSMARIFKRFGQELGEDYPGEVDQIIDEAMAEASGSQGAGGPGEDDGAWSDED